MSDSSTEPLDSPTQLDPLQVALVSCLAMAVMSLGGYASGLAITKFGTLGAASLWLIGEVAGAAGRKLIPEKNKLAGVILAVACVVAFLVAEVCWIHWRIVPAQQSWSAAIRYLPTFVERYTTSALIGAICCFMGASSAYRKVARRYRIVHVVEE